MSHRTYPKVTHTDATSVPPTPAFPAIEDRVLAYWKEDGTFEASVDQRDAGENGDNEFVFYDGPPFANGLPHYGHLLTGYVKDLIPRYRTMRGSRVERRFGWDTHGLPAELEAMRLKGIKTTDEIVEMGIDVFNDACRTSVFTYTDEWQDYVTRQARWVDFEHDYKTLDLDYMESVIWAFKELYDKGLVYEGFRVLPYCWNDETPLSNHELRMDDDVYQQRQDPAVTVGCRLETGEIALVWTTTPWTLTANLAIMVNPDIEYVVVESSFTGTTERYVIGAERLAAYERELKDEDRDLEDQVLERLTGRDLMGRSYTPPMTYFVGHEKAFRVVEADFVTTSDGTGLVHTAGAFGEEDKAITDREGIELVVPVALDGTFTFPVTDYEGMHVFDANLHIIDHLKAMTRGEGDTGSISPGTVLLRRETYEHSYPHCWRCRNPLIYMAVSSWFVSTTSIRDRMLELNQEIRWVPDHVKDGQFGKWLENTRDWSISRNRFWGSPIPVWKSDDLTYPRVDVYGSLEEIERDFGVRPDDLHRPFIDDLTRPNPDDPTGKSTMRRVTDVFDCWFESGSMPFAQVHYPFENADWFENHYPGDFIVEYIGQTRGWFYTMHVLAAGLFDRPAFETCVSHGVVLGSDGNKMSKSLRNYPNVYEVFDRDGADAMRWFLMSSPILRGGNLIVTERGIRESVRQVLIPLWNTWYFFALYANAANDGRGHDAAVRPTSTHVMDRYVLAKLRRYIEDMTRQLDNYEVANACDSTRTFLEVLTNWYVRRSRDRFWGESAEAFDTLWTVLETVCRVAAPLLPLTTEEVWRGLTGERSVHLTDWPDADTLPDDPALVSAMDEVRDVASAGSALRKAHGLRNRLPLASLTLVVDDVSAVAGFESILADELNVKDVRLVLAGSDQAAAYAVEQRLTVNARAAGPRLGREVQTVIKGSKSGDWSVAEDGTVTCAGIELAEGEFTLETVAGDGDDHAATAVLPRGGFIVLDTALTPELEAEGVARDLVRTVQQARRDAGLDVSDRINLTVAGPSDVLAAARLHEALLTAETLAASVSHEEAAETSVEVVRA